MTYSVINQKNIGFIRKYYTLKNRINNKFKNKTLDSIYKYSIRFKKMLFSSILDGFAIFATLFYICAAYAITKKYKKYTIGSMVIGVLTYFVGFQIVKFLVF